jgi:hypothetical protein
MMYSYQKIGFDANGAHRLSAGSTALVDGRGGMSQ